MEKKKGVSMDLSTVQKMGLKDLDTVPFNRSANAV